MSLWHPHVCRQRAGSIVIPKVYTEEYSWSLMAISLAFPGEGFLLFPALPCNTVLFIQNTTKAYCCDQENIAQIRTMQREYLTSHVSEWEIQSGMLQFSGGIVQNWSQHSSTCQKYYKGKQVRQKKWDEGQQRLKVVRDAPRIRQVVNHVLWSLLSMLYKNQ